LTTVVERDAVKRLHEILEYIVEAAVGAAVENVVDFISNPTGAAKKGCEEDLKLQA